jgi:hypothetical protein
MMTTIWLSLSDPHLLSRNFTTNSSANQILTFFLLVTPRTATSAFAEAAWRCLRISKLDTRRIQVLIPRATPLGHAMSLGKDSISADQMHDNWMLPDELHVNFLSSQGAVGVHAPNCVGNDDDDESND